MNLYVVLAVFLISSATILACLDHLKLRFARNLFAVLTIEIILYIPYAMCGADIVEFCQTHQALSFPQQVLAFVNYALQVSNPALLSITMLLMVIAILLATATIILVVHTARAICKLVQKLTHKQPTPKHHKNKLHQHQLVHTKIQYKRILYLRFCRLNS